MVGPALRSWAVAGVLAATFVFGGVPAAAPVVAQPGDDEATSQDTDEPDDTVRKRDTYRVVFGVLRKDS